MGTTISGDTGVVFPDATTQSTAVTVATPFSINASAGAGAQLRLPEATANGVNYVAVKAADALSSNVTFTLPTADGTSGQYLQTNGAGQLSFSSVVIPPGTPVGGIQYFAPGYAPGAAWLPCDGSYLTQASYPALYATIGLISDGGAAWNTVNTGSSSTLWDIAYGLSTYVIVGASGTIRTTTSPTLASGTFSGPSAGTANTLRSVAFGNGTFVAVGDSGSITRSTDAVTWTHQLVGANAFYDVIFANGLFVTCNDASPPLIYTSTDGVTWTSRTSGFTSSAAVYFAYGNSRFVAGSANGRVSTSTDGISWTGTTVTNIGEFNFRALTFGNGYYVAGSSNSNLAYSTNGTDWYTTPAPILPQFTGVAFAGGKFLAVSNSSGMNGAVSYGPSAFLPTNMATTGTTQRVRVVNNFFIWTGNTGACYRSSVYNYNTSTQFVLPNGYAPSMNGQIPYIRVTA
jgi:hypothetical protein